MKIKSVLKNEKQKKRGIKYIFLIEETKMKRITNKIK